MSPSQAQHAAMIGLPAIKQLPPSRRSRLPSASKRPAIFGPSGVTSIFNFIEFGLLKSEFSNGFDTALRPHFNSSRLCNHGEIISFGVERSTRDVGVGFFYLQSAFGKLAGQILWGKMLKPIVKRPISAGLDDGILF